MKSTACLLLFLLMRVYVIQSGASRNHIVLLESNSTSVTIHFFPAQEVQTYNCSVNLKELPDKNSKRRVVHQDDMGGLFHNRITFDSLLPDKAYVFSVSFDGSAPYRYPFFTAHQTNAETKIRYDTGESRLARQSATTPTVLNYQKAFEEMIRELELLELVADS